VGASKIARDITARKRTEEALRQARAQLADRAVQLEAAVAERTAELNETISELEGFCYSITHDMRAPLRSMQGFAGLVTSQCGDKIGPESQDHLRRIGASAERMDRLIVDVLQYSRVMRAELKLEPVNLESLLDGILESYPNLKRPGVEVVIERPLPEVLGNQGALTQCFSNLLDNAVKFVPLLVKPRVRVWAETGGGAVRVFVEDNGVGIPREMHEKIFGIFEQLSRKYEGTGIGLAIVRKAMTRMGGRVGLESEPGKGSTFWLEFKRADS
jgi:signal transduction histidine kinase